ncbi:hypothetical protein BS47DRAFT_1365359, partial [Hydnum rufescens UP504]
YRLNHPQNESPKPNAPRNTPRRTPDKPHPLWRVCDNSKTVKPNDNPPNEPPWGMMMRLAMTPAKRTTPTTTGQTKPKRAPHTRFCGFCHLNPTPATPPNEHGRTTTHPPNESRERQQVETTTQAQTNPTPASAGVVIFKVFF